MRDHVKLEVESSQILQTSNPYALAFTYEPVLVRDNISERNLVIELKKTILEILISTVCIKIFSECFPWVHNLCFYIGDCVTFLFIVCVDHASSKKAFKLLKILAKLVRLFLVERGRVTLSMKQHNMSRSGCHYNWELRRCYADEPSGYLAVYFSNLTSFEQSRVDVIRL